MFANCTVVGLLKARKRTMVGIEFSVVLLKNFVLVFVLVLVVCFSFSFG